MVDIHCHLLWGLDDGAKTLEESIAMARLAAETGTTDLVATPHANDHYKFDEGLIRERVDELRQACPEGPKIHTGSDFHLSFINIEDALRAPQRYTVNQSAYLMVELPDLLVPTMLQIFERMRDAGILPVITHPERNRALWRDERVFDRFLAAGCLVQITAQSLEGHFGRTARDLAWRLIEEDRVDFVASDGHDPSFRPPRLDRAFSLVAKKQGEATALRLFRTNPAQVVAGTRLPQREAKPNRGIFRLFR